MRPIAYLLVSSALACSSFDEYPQGDLCANAVRDAEGRAIYYPEWRICRPLAGSAFLTLPAPGPLTDAGSEASATPSEIATTQASPNAADAGSRDPERDE